MGINPFVESTDQQTSEIKNDEIMEKLMNLLNLQIEVINSSNEDELFLFDKVAHFELVKSFKEFYFDFMCEMNAKQYLKDIPTELKSNSAVSRMLDKWIKKYHPMLKFLK